ncbi:hypothetical protein G9A89_008254 [Geosiphon pyriformis]|nr:hypothetical protein G9A89_008254 [Geosiphon pyriformis]
MGNLQTKKTRSEAYVKNSRPYAHDCNECKSCQEGIKSRYNPCAACRFLFFEKLYYDFSSGNEVVDKIIKNPIYIPRRSNDKLNYGIEYNGELNYYEWILWENLSNIKEIGRGGFGIIYKATLIDGRINLGSIKHYGEMEYKREGIGTEVAIKVIKTNSSEVLKELNIQRLIFNNGSSLTWISSMYGITQNAETLEYGIVMEFSKLGDMRTYLSTNFYSMSWKDKLEIARDIVIGLDSIHNSGMVHRDLHSGNILQYESAWVNPTRTQICDLGLCQPVNTETTTTEEKKIHGVIPYIPPEVLKGENFTTAGDIYSYGMLLWELATGKPPFYDCKHDQILIMAISNGQRPKITTPLIPPCFAKIIVKCWDANPKNRPTAKEVWSKLFRLLYIYNRFKEGSYSRFRKKSRDEIIDKGRQFLESDKYVKETLKNDSITNTKSLYKDSTTTTAMTTTKTTTTTAIHSGAVYTSRVLIAQMVDFSEG